MLALRPHAGDALEARGGHEQRGLPVSRPERPQPLELLRERQAERAARDDGVDLLDGDQIGRRQRLAGVGGQGGPEGRDLRGVDLEAGRHAVAAEAAEVPARRGEPGVQVVGGDAAAGAAPGLPVEGDDNARPPPALHEARGDDPDDSGCQPRHHQRGGRRLRGARLVGGEQDPRLGLALVAVEQVELVGDPLRAGAVVGHQQLERRVGPLHAPGGVEARAEREAERALVDLAGLDAGDRHQGPQPRLAGP